MRPYAQMGTIQASQVQLATEFEASVRSRPHTDGPRILPDLLNRPPPVSSKGTGRRPVRNSQ